jgi:hypothetical protein
VALLKDNPVAIRRHIQAADGLIGDAVQFGRLLIGEGITIDRTNLLKARTEVISVEEKTTPESSGSQTK